jgi:hypothetical protein
MMPKISSWTKYEIEHLMNLRETQRKKWEDIAVIMGRSRTAVQAKWTYVTNGYSREPRHVMSISVAPTAQEVERRARLMAPPRDLSGFFFGDPPLGYSALDRRDSHEFSHRISPDYRIPSPDETAFAFAGEAAE